MHSPPQSEMGPTFGTRCHFGKLRFEEVHYGASLHMPVHSHQEAFLDLCLQGTIQEHWSQTTFVRGAASLNFLPVGVPHGSCFPETAQTFQIVMNASWLEPLQQFAPVCQIPIHYKDGPVTWIAARLYREFQHWDAVSPLVLEGLLLELMAQMSRQSCTIDETSCPRWLRQTQDFLHAHFTESLAIEAIATEVDIHPAHLMRSFRAHYRCTVGEYVRKLRVDYACHLLTTSNASFSQIAHAAGFADQSHFHRTFKGLLGMTPAMFRKAAGHSTRRASGEQEMLL